MSVPPSYYAQGNPDDKKGVVTSQPSSTTISDQLFIDKLNAIRKYDVRQGNVMLEAVTLGAMSNVYVIGDSERPAQVEGFDKPVSVPNPVFIAREEDTSCCCKLCCPGNQPLLVRVYHAKDGVKKGDTACGCCYMGHKYVADETTGPLMTLERQGCCSRCLGCFLCSGKCENDMFIHSGNYQGPIGSTTPQSQYLGRSILSRNTPCFTPTVDLYTGNNTQSPKPFAAMEGPTCFAGWKGLCCGDVFKVSSQRGGMGDIATITKPKSNTCGEVCTQMCTDVDHYDLETRERFAGMSSEQKAVVLSSSVHLDYLFFENDQPPCTVHRQGKNTVIACNLCQVFCKGCVFPCVFCVVISDTG